MARVIVKAGRPVPPFLTLSGTVSRFRPPRGSGRGLQACPEGKCLSSVTPQPGQRMVRVGSRRSMAEDGRDPGFEAFDAKLKRLRGEPEAGPVADLPEAQPPMRLSQGFQAGVEVIAGVIGGALIGYGLDYWLGTSPLCLIVLFVLGAAAGVLNAYRTLKRAVKH